MTLRDRFGDIDIYLFDQLLKDRFTPNMTVLDAGCGGGRNLVYLMRSGYQVFGVDRSAEAVEQIRQQAAALASDLPAANFRECAVEQMPFRDGEFDVVISSAVLHFATDESHFDRMVRELWRVLKPGGLMFCRLASSIGIEGRIVHLDGRRYRLPDGTDRFLVDQSMLLALTEELGGELADPIKTTNVQDQRCMTTWVVRKSS